MTEESPEDRAARLAGATEGVGAPSDFTAALMRRLEDERLDHARGDVRRPRFVDRLRQGIPVALATAALAAGVAVFAAVGVERSGGVDATADDGEDAGGVFEDVEEVE